MPGNRRSGRYKNQYKEAERLQALADDAAKKAAAAEKNKDTSTATFYKEQYLLYSTKAQKEIERVQIFEDSDSFTRD